MSAAIQPAHTGETCGNPDVCAAADTTKTAPTTPVTTDTIEVQLSHRTIRSFTDEPVTNNEVESLLTVAGQAPTWAFYQQRTIIHIKDPHIRNTIATVANQAYVGGDHGELFVFVADLYRNQQIRREKGADDEWLHTMSALMTAIYDTTLAAQNMVVAAESMGLGTVYLGSIGREPRTVIDLLHLPKMTYPVFGLLVGHPDEEPQFKPRLPLGVCTSVDRYPEVDSYAQVLVDYDEAVHTYYDLRNRNRRVDEFTTQIATKLGLGGADVTDVLAVLREQGLAQR